MTEQDKKILFSLQGLCARREYCRGDILTKAIRMTGGDSELSEEILGELTREGYVDDGRYASAFARDKSALAGWGPVKIRYSLRKKGIDERIISEALSGMDPEKSSEKMERVLREKFRTLGKDDPASIGKLVRFGLSRGYLYDELMSFIDRIRGDE